jgi:hypothetical protein
MKHMNWSKRFGLCKSKKLPWRTPPHESQGKSNGGRACIIQAWGRKPTGGQVKAGNKRELKALRDLVDLRAVEYSRFPADHTETHRYTSNGYTEHSVEHIYTLTDQGRGILEYLTKNNLLKTA